MLFGVCCPVVCCLLYVGRSVVGFVVCCCWLCAVCLLMFAVVVCCLCLRVVWCLLCVVDCWLLCCVRCLWFVV